MGHLTYLAHIENIHDENITAFTVLIRVIRFYSPVNLSGTVSGTAMTAPR